jgi:hypothetical protein
MRKDTLGKIVALLEANGKRAVLEVGVRSRLVRIEVKEPERRTGTVRRDPLTAALFGAPAGDR